MQAVFYALAAPAKVTLKTLEACLIDDDCHHDDCSGSLHNTRDAAHLGDILVRSLEQRGCLRARLREMHLAMCLKNDKLVSMVRGKIGTEDCRCWDDRDSDEES